MRNWRGGLRNLKLVKFNKKKNIPALFPPKKILFVSSYEKIGGSNTVIWDLGRKFMDDRWSISILYPRYHPIHSKLIEEGINVIINQEIFSHLDQNLEFFKQYDLVILNEWSCYKWVHEIKKFGISVIWIIHGNNRARFEFFKINKFDFSAPDKIICVSDFVKNSFLEFQTKNNFLTIHNGVDLQRIQNFIQENNKNKIREKFEISDKNIVITIIGRINERKGQDVFIEMANIVSQSNISNLRFVIAGFGTDDDVDKIKELIEKYNLQSKISLILHPKNIYEIYLISDILVSCSRSEGFGLVLLEAMGFDLPIIATNGGGTPEFIIDNVNGFLINPREPIKLSEKIRILLADPKISEKFVNQNKLRAGDFDIRKISQKYKKVIEEIFMNDI